MPNRIIREGFLDSERVNLLSAQAEGFFVRLMLKVDDFGRYHAHTSLLRASLYPLKIDSIREADISRWIQECEKAGLIALYETQSKRYLVILDFRQRTRAPSSRFPDPPSGIRQTNDRHMTVMRQTPAHVVGDDLSETYSEASAVRAREGPEAQIPSEKEFIAAFMVDGIPEDYLREKWLYFDANASWLNSQGKPRDWARLVRSWWASDRERWRTKNQRGRRDREIPPSADGVF